jgi:hypothetical protein
MIVVRTKLWVLLPGTHHFQLFLLKKSYDEDDNESSVFKRHDTIHALAGMLAKNEQVDYIQVEDPFDCDVCDAVVFPRININSYRKHFLVIQKLQNPVCSDG